MQPEQRKRPTGVTIIAILSIIGGIFAIIGGAAITLLVPVLVSEDLMSSSNIGNAEDISFVDEPAAFLVAMGFISIGVGVFSLIVAYGLLKGLHWAWAATLVISIISIGMTFASMYFSSNPGNFVSIIISGVVIYYLYRPHVKSYFEKASTSPKL